MSRRLPTVTPRKAIAALERGGFYVHHTTGGHYALRHPDNLALKVTVPYHNRDLKRQVLHSIIRQAGLSVDAFIDLL